jgi:hypothetical protein
MRRPRREGPETDRFRARGRIANLVRRQLLPRASDVPCHDCGHVYAVGSDPRHEYDHYLGYAPEHRESVQAVCIPCHVKRETARRRVVP